MYEEGQSTVLCQPITARIDVLRMLHICTSSLSRQGKGRESAEQRLGSADYIRMQVQHWLGHRCRSAHLSDIDSDCSSERSRMGREGKEAG